MPRFRSCTRRLARMKPPRHSLSQPAKKIHATIAEDLNQFTKSSGAKSLEGRSFVVTGEVLAMQETPLDFYRSVLEAG